MRIGTFWCMLWGHKFIIKECRPSKKTEAHLEPFMKNYEYVMVRTDFCMRCGIKDENY